MAAGKRRRIVRATKRNMDRFVETGEGLVVERSEQKASPKPGKVRLEDVLMKDLDGLGPDEGFNELLDKYDDDGNRRE